jgi:hypothetical protein
MAAPNLAGVTTVTGKTAVYECGTSLGSVLSNGAASGKVLKINSIRAANIDDTATISTSITVRRSSVDYYIVKSVSVPLNSSLVILSKDEYLYLEEGDAIFASGSSNLKIDILVAYEELS